MKKTELLERVREGRAKLGSALDGLSEEEATRTGLNPQWSVKDALAHVVAWELEGASIIRAIQERTGKPAPLDKEQIDAFNARAVEERRERTMREVSDELDAAHGEMERLIESLPDEVNESSMTYKYIEGVTFHHHESHATQIEEYKQHLRDR